MHVTAAAAAAAAGSTAGTVGNYVRPTAAGLRLISGHLLGPLKLRWAATRRAVLHLLKLEDVLHD